MQQDNVVVNSKPKSPFIKPKKELTLTEQNRIKRFERKVREGKLGRFWSWVDFTREKPVIGMKDFQQYEASLGRIGNRVYCLGDSGRYVLYRKLKNTTKAKKFMEDIN